MENEGDDGDKIREPLKSWVGETNAETVIVMDSKRNGSNRQSTLGCAMAMAVMESCNRVLNVEVLLLDLGFWIVSETEMAGSAEEDT